jgi:hypothetical protein
MLAIKLLRRDYLAFHVLCLNIILLYIIGFPVFINAFLVGSILVPLFESVLGLIHITSILQGRTRSIAGAMVGLFTGSGSGYNESENYKLFHF